MKNQLDILKVGAEYRIRPNGDKIVVVPADNFDKLFTVFELAQSITNARLQKRYFSPGDKSQDFLTGKIENNLSELERIIAEIKNGTT